jgi:multimeric flavodoxin WrbA
LGYGKAYSCVCAPLEPSRYQELVDQYDAIVIGTPIEVVVHDDELKSMWTKAKQFTEVKIKIEKVLKGKIDSGFIVVNQFGTGNCGRMYKFGENYLIFGDRINSFSMGDKYKSTIPDPCPPPPPPNEFINGTMTCHSEEEKEVEFWKNISRKEFVIFSDYCISFYTNSDLGKEMIDFLSAH